MSWGMLQQRRIDKQRFLDDQHVWSTRKLKKPDDGAPGPFFYSSILLAIRPTNPPICPLMAIHLYTHPFIQPIHQSIHHPSFRPSTRSSIYVSSIDSSNQSNHPSIQQLTYSFIHPNIHPSSHHLTRSFIHASNQSNHSSNHLIHSSINLFINPPITQLVHPSIHPSLDSFIHPSIHKTYRPNTSSLPLFNYQQHFQLCSRKPNGIPWGQLGYVILPASSGSALRSLTIYSNCAQKPTCAKELLWSKTSY